jgi:hypothetical protein
MKHRIKKYHDLVDGEKKFVTGLLPDTKDPLDLDTVGIFGLFEDYQPKFGNVTPQELGIKVKDQGPKNICGWVGMTANRQNTEKVELAEQGIVQFGKRDGLISGDGFSNLRDNCKIAQKYGIPEARFLPNDPTIPWEEYSRFSMSNEAIENAYSHRSQSYAQVTDKNSLLKWLDEGNYLHTGSLWYNEYNMRGGFSYPWVINKPGNVVVGGHAYEIPREAGYVKNYLNRGLHLRFQNSYTESWGDKGFFYMPIDFALTQMLYSRWINLDIAVDLARFLQENSNHNVRAEGGKAVYLITSGKKFAYPDWLTFLAFEGLKEDILVVDPASLDAVPRGGDMRIDTAPLWSIIKDMAAPDNYKKLIQIMSQQKALSGAVGAADIGWIMFEVYEEMIKAIKS